MAQSGDVPVVLYDYDTSRYFTLTKQNFEFQRMKNNRIRISVGVNDYHDNKEPDCIECSISLKSTTNAPIVHGVTCEKITHKGGGYLHHEDDDSPYNVDGLTYCGRCHYAL